MGKTDLEIPQAFFFVFPPGKGEDLPRKGGFGHYLEVGLPWEQIEISLTQVRLCRGHWQGLPLATVRLGESLGKREAS